MENSMALPANCFPQLYPVVSEILDDFFVLFLLEFHYLGEYLLTYCIIQSYLHSPADNCAKILELVGSWASNAMWSMIHEQSSPVWLGQTGSSLTTIKWQFARGWLWSPYNSNNYVWLGLLIMEKLHCPSTPGLDKPLLRSCAVNLIYYRQTPKLPHKTHGYGLHIWPSPPTQPSSNIANTCPCYP